MAPATRGQLQIHYMPPHHCFALRFSRFPSSHAHAIKNVSLEVLGGPSRFGLPGRGAFVEFCAFALLYQPCPGDNIDSIVLSPNTPKQHERRLQ